MGVQKISFALACIGALGMGADAFAATKSSKQQSAIKQGTSVRTKIEAKGLYNQDCYDAYFGCMDQFCITDNSDGGSCACSDESLQYETQLTQIKEKLEEAERIRTVEVERIQAGADADIIFTGSRRYDADGNVIQDFEEKTDDTKAKQRESLMALFETDFSDDDSLFESDFENIGDKQGDALYKAVDNLCQNQIPDSCGGDLAFLRQLYSRQIKSDCVGFKNSVATRLSAADRELADAEAAVRGALKESLDAANKYDLGECMVEFRKCMQTTDACGSDWGNCVSTIASQNMQNNKRRSTAGTKVASVNTYDITASTMEILESKRVICERVLDQCMSVRNMVWPNFLREVAPTIRLAETQQESKFRQSCLTNISECIQTACRDDIAGKGVATMDACLSRPDMARSFCKVEIDPCERMEPLIWGYVTDKLAAMRVDACTAEVKDCFTADTRCGTDFQNCIGMDYDYIHDICPIDSLVVCKANNPEFSMDDLDSMLMGLYLNIDNSALTQCQNLVDEKMIEICGSTTDCNKFATDDKLGTGSLQSQKDGNKYRVTGMISFGSIKMGDTSGTVKDGKNVLGPGEIGVADYIVNVQERNSSVRNANGIISSIEQELNNIAGTINRTIDLIESDPEIQFCINGRDLSQITGKSGQKTTGRFPNLLNQVKMQIATAALRQAQDNYNEKFNTAVATATKDASADLAQYLCQMLPYNSAAASSSTQVDTALAEPYAISYEVGAGLDNAMLTAKSGRSSSATSGAAGFESKKLKVSVSGGTREMWSVFNRDTRTCHYCTSTVTKNCKTESKNGFWGIGAKTTQDCTESEPIEVCEDIVM